MPDATAARLCLTIDLANMPDAAERLAVVLPIARPATIVIENAKGLDEGNVRDLVRRIQKASVAAVISGDTRLTLRVGADGTHIPWSKTTAEDARIAREALGPDRILGADAGRSRHDAMEIGELGADYVAFGIPPHVEDLETARGRQIDLVQWWSDLFEIPTVAFDVATLEDAEALARHGADFIAVALPAAIPVADLEAWAEAAAAAVSSRTIAA